VVGQASLASFVSSSAGWSMERGGSRLKRLGEMTLTAGRGSKKRVKRNESDC
jgi:hypothetical protein